MGDFLTVLAEDDRELEFAISTGYERGLHLDTCTRRAGTGVLDFGKDTQSGLARRHLSGRRLDAEGFGDPQQGWCRKHGHVAGPDSARRIVVRDRKAVGCPPAGRLLAHAAFMGRAQPSSRVEALVEMVADEAAEVHETRDAHREQNEERRDRDEPE